jgi:hypothetical protein
MNARAWILGLAVAALPLAVAAADDATQLTIKSGSPQTVHAWVAARTKKYEMDIPAALVVNAAPDKAKIRFRCITPGCEFPPSDQPDSVSRVDPSAYDVTVAKGAAAIKLTIWTTTPESVVVVAQPAGAKDPQVRFILNEH